MDIFGFSTLPLGSLGSQDISILGSARARTESAVRPEIFIYAALIFAVVTVSKSFYDGIRAMFKIAPKTSLLIFSTSSWCLCYIEGTMAYTLGDTSLPFISWKVQLARWLLVLGTVSMALLPLLILIPFCEDSSEISSFYKRQRGDRRPSPSFKALGALSLALTGLYHVLISYLLFCILYFGPWSANIELVHAISVGVVYLMVSLVFSFCGYGFLQETDAVHPKTSAANETSILWFIRQSFNYRTEDNYGNMAERNFLTSRSYVDAYRRLFVLVNLALMSGEGYILYTDVLRIINRKMLDQPFGVVTIALSSFTAVAQLITVVLVLVNSTRTRKRLTELKAARLELLIATGSLAGSRSEKIGGSGKGINDRPSGSSGKIKASNLISSPIRNIRDNPLNTAIDIDLHPKDDFAPIEIIPKSLQHLSASKIDLVTSDVTVATSLAGPRSNFPLSDSYRSKSKSNTARTRKSRTVRSSIISKSSAVENTKSFAVDADSIKAKTSTTSALVLPQEIPVLSLPKDVSDNNIRLANSPSSVSSEVSVLMSELQPTYTRERPAYLNPNPDRSSSKLIIPEENLSNQESPETTEKSPSELDKPKLEIKITCGNARDIDIRDQDSSINSIPSTVAAILLDETFVELSVCYRPQAVIFDVELARGNENLKMKSISLRSIPHISQTSAIEYVEFKTENDDVFGCLVGKSKQHSSRDQAHKSDGFLNTRPVVCDEFLPASIASDPVLSLPFQKVPRDSNFMAASAIVPSYCQNALRSRLLSKFQAKSEESLLAKNTKESSGLNQRAKSVPNFEFSLEFDGKIADEATVEPDKLSRIELKDSQPLRTLQHSAFMGEILKSDRCSISSLIQGRELEAIVKTNERNSSEPYIHSAASVTRASSIGSENVLTPRLTTRRRSLKSKYNTPLPINTYTAAFTPNSPPAYVEAPPAPPEIPRPASLDEISIEICGDGGENSENFCSSNEIEVVMSWIESIDGIGCRFLPRFRDSSQNILLKPLIYSFSLYGPYIFPRLLRLALNIGTIEASEVQKRLISGITDRFELKYARVNDGTGAACELRKIMRTILLDLPSDMLDWAPNLMTEVDIQKFFACLESLMRRQGKMDNLT